MCLVSLLNYRSSHFFASLYIRNPPWQHVPTLLERNRYKRRSYDLPTYQLYPLKLDFTSLIATNSGHIRLP